VAEDELLKTLMQFHREIVRPEFQEIRDEMKSMRAEMVTRDEFLSHIDAIYKRFDRLETEYQSIRVALQRLEQRMAVVGENIDKIAIRSELEELKERIAQLEKQLN
jgi:predicted nuclease with TOPRIM domain